LQLHGLYRVLRNHRVQAFEVSRRTSSNGVICAIELAEFSGRDLSRNRWTALQGPVLDCLIEAACRGANFPEPAPRPWHVFCDMLQNSSPRRPSHTPDTPAAVTNV
jgi:hypothetical protein